MSRSKNLDYWQAIEHATGVCPAGLDSLIRCYSENADRMRYDEYLRLGYGIGSGAVEARISKWCMPAFGMPE